MAKIAVVGVPTAAAARGPGVDRAPFVLREQGLLRALAADGTRVVNLSDLSLFPYRPDEAHPRARNVEVVACAVRAAADEMTRALREGFTLMLGGDSTVVVGALAGARAHLGAPAGLVYVDAHADLHTPETTRSGYLQGMTVALCLGRGPESVSRAYGTSPATEAARVALVGVREWEPGEREAALALALGLVLSAEEVAARGPADTASAVLNAIPGPLIVHFNVDVVRPEEMPAVERPTGGGGLTMVQAADLLRTLVASPRVVALVLTQYDPAPDAEGVHARHVVDLVASALARRAPAGEATRPGVPGDARHTP